MASSGNKALAPSAAATLTNEQRTAILSGQTKGLSANKILDSLTNTGIGLNRQRGLTAINELAGLRGNGVGIMQTARSFTPSLSVHVISPFVPTGTFRYWASYTATSPVTGQTQPYTAVISFDQLSTREQIEEALLGVLGTASESYNFSLNPTNLVITTAEMGL